jgi:hypothetical protein
MELGISSDRTKEQKANVLGYQHVEMDSMGQAGTGLGGEDAAV